MITLIIKQYVSILMWVGAGSLLALLLGVLALFWLFKKPVIKTMRSAVATDSTDHSHDLSAIAGDDVMATQLDLARAYIEAGRAAQAKKILEYVLEKGSEIQQKEARNLLLVCAA